MKADRPPVLSTFKAHWGVGASNRFDTSQPVRSPRHLKGQPFACDVGSFAGEEAGAWSNQYRIAFTFHMAMGQKYRVAKEPYWKKGKKTQLSAISSGFLFDPQPHDLLVL